MNRTTTMLTAVALVARTVVGRGGAGQLRGGHELEPGGIPGAGPHTLRLDVRER